jgi:hypothetical protein
MYNIKAGDLVAWEGRVYRVKMVICYRLLICSEQYGDFQIVNDDEVVVVETQKTTH